MGKNPFDEVAAANDARFEAVFGKRREAVERVDWRVDPLFSPKDANAVANMAACVKIAAGYRAGLTGLDAEKLAATVSVQEVLASDSPMEALERALDAGEAKLRELGA